MSELAQLRAGVVFARDYTLRLLDHVPRGDWFRMPPGGVTHAAWQVGHLAMAEYRLVLERVRGRRPDDANLIPPEFLITFGRDSLVSPDPAAYPTADEIVAVFDRVHVAALGAIDAGGFDLDAPAETPHAFCVTKRDCLRWCSHHEMVHAGQLGLLRRLLGQPPVW